MHSFSCINSEFSKTICLKIMTVVMKFPSFAVGLGIVKDPLFYYFCIFMHSFSCINSEFSKNYLPKNNDSSNEVFLICSRVGNS